MAPPTGTSRKASAKSALPKATYRLGFVLDGVFTNLRNGCDDLKRQAAALREIIAVNPAADTLDYAAKFFARLVDKIERDHDYVTAEEYADLHNVTPQSVCNWIRKGELNATPTNNGYRISRNAKRRKKGEAA